MISLDDYEFWALEFSRLGMLTREVKEEAVRRDCVWARAFCDKILDAVAKAEYRLSWEGVLSEESWPVHGISSPDVPVRVTEKESISCK